MLHSKIKPTTRTRFLLDHLRILLFYFITLDILDTITKTRVWDTTLTHPISSLPIPLRIIYFLSVGGLMLLSVSFPYEIVAVVCVGLGSHPDTWQPFYNQPFTSMSLAEFWTKRWHLSYRRAFTRLAHPFWLLASKCLPRFTANIIRVSIIFSLSALLHLLTMYRLPTNEKFPHNFLDHNTIACFLMQPIGLVVESLFVTPLTRPLPGPIRDTLRRTWAWGFMFWTGSYWCDVWVRRGMCDRDEGGLEFSLVRLLSWGPLDSYMK